MSDDVKFPGFCTTIHPAKYKNTFMGTWHLREEEVVDGSGYARVTPVPTPASKEDAVMIENKRSTAVWIYKNVGFLLEKTCLGCGDPIPIYTHCYYRAGTIGAWLCVRCPPAEVNRPPDERFWNELGPIDLGNGVKLTSVSSSSAGVQFGLTPEDSEKTFYVMQPIDILLSKGREGTVRWLQDLAQKHSSRFWNNLAPMELVPGVLLDRVTDTEDRFGFIQFHLKVAGAPRNKTVSYIRSSVVKDGEWSLISALRETASLYAREKEPASLPWDHNLERAMQAGTTIGDSDCAEPACTPEEQLIRNRIVRHKPTEKNFVSVKASAPIVPWNPYGDDGEG